MGMAPNQQPTRFARPTERPIWVFEGVGGKEELVRLNGIRKTLCKVPGKDCTKLFLNVDIDDISELIR